MYNQAGVYNMRDLLRRCCNQAGVDNMRRHEGLVEQEADAY